MSEHSRLLFPGARCCDAKSHTLGVCHTHFSLYLQLTRLPPQSSSISPITSNFHSGVGQGGGTGGATAPPPLLKVGGGSAPPLFGYVCTLNERKGSYFSMSATNVEQLNQNFCLRLHQKLVRALKHPKDFWGGCPQTPLNRNKKSCPHTFHDLPTPLFQALALHSSLPIF